MSVFKKLVLSTLFVAGIFTSATQLLASVNTVKQNNNPTAGGQGNTGI